MPVILEAITIIALGAMVLTTLLGALDRFLFSFGLPWPEDLARFLLIWTSLRAAAVAAKYQAHFRLTFLYDRLGPLWSATADLLCIGSLMIVAWQGVLLAEIFHMQRSPALNLPMSVVYASVPVSSVLMAYYMSKNLVARWRSKAMAR
jgi:TRAP-type C4-dicarboxylate transport system permease small subunit